MEWVTLSRTSAFFLATSDALAKKALQDQNEFLVTWFRMLFTLPVLVVTLFLVPWPRLDADFYLAFFAALPLELITVILYIKAFKRSPLSLTMPFLALTPVFLIAVSYAVLGEKVSAVAYFVLSLYHKHRAAGMTDHLFCYAAHKKSF